MSDTEICNKVLNALGKSTSANTTPNYVPQVGDVVEFYNHVRGYKCKGVISGGLVIQTSSNASVSFYRDPNYKKIGRIDGVTDTTSYTETQDLLEDFLKDFAQPTFTGSYEERQAQWVKHHGLKVGSKVKVVRSFKKGDIGFDYSSKGNEYIGEYAEIVEINNEKLWIRLSSDLGNWKIFPYMALEPVK